MTVRSPLPFLDTSSELFLADPFHLLRAARESHWLAQSPRGFEVLSHESVEQMFRDKRFHEGGPQIADACGLSGIAYERRIGDTMFQEGETHQRMRRVVARFFTPRAMERFRARARSLFDERLTAIEAAGQAELVAELAVPVPSQLFCEVLGAPLADAPFLARTTAQSLKTFLLDPAHAKDIAAGLDELSGYLGSLAEERDRNGGDDFMSAIAEARRNGTLTTDEMIHLAMSIVEGSSDNTSNTLLLALLTLSAHPEQWQKLRQDPDRAPAAVEESMRFLPRVRSQVKGCDQDTAFRDFTFPAGSWIYQSLDAANRDPLAFPDPDTFSITRTHSARQLAFGTGRHICIGAPLARIELSEAIRAIAERWRSFEMLVPPDVSLDANVRTVNRMEISVTRAGHV